MQSNFSHSRVSTSQRVLLLTLTYLLALTLAKAQDVLTYRNGVARTGQYLTETILTPSNVNSSTFGKLFTVSVDGMVDGQPLYASGVPLPSTGIHNVLIVATEHDSVYAFDADTGAVIWHISVLTNGETASDAPSCDQAVPELGITSTPVIDRSRGPNGTIYVVAMSKDTSNNHFQRLHALDLATGAEALGGPTTVQATYPGPGDNSSAESIVFDPAQSKATAGLLLLDGVIYTAWASPCDIRPYAGWIIGYDATTLMQTTVTTVTRYDSGGATPMSGAGLAADRSGTIYHLDGSSFTSNTNDIHQQLTGALPRELWSTPAYFKHLLYLGPADSPISAFEFANALHSSQPVAQTRNSFAYPGTSPSVSADNDTNGIVWAVENGRPAVLYAYDANTLNEVYNSGQAPASRDALCAGNPFATPIIAGGKVYVATSNCVAVFGLLTSGVPAALSSRPLGTVNTLPSATGAGTTTVADIRNTAHDSSSPNRADACSTAANTLLGSGWTMAQCQGTSSNPPPAYPTSISLATTNPVGLGHWIIAAIQEAGGYGEDLYCFRQPGKWRRRDSYHRRYSGDICERPAVLTEWVLVDQRCELSLERQGD